MRFARITGERTHGCDISACGKKGRVPVSAEGFLRSRERSDVGERVRATGLQVRFAPVAWLVGAGFLGFGIDGFFGAGVGLMLPATVLFLGALVDSGDGPQRRSRSPRRKTLRHRWFLWLDQLARRHERARDERRARKEAERRFLDSRRKREES
jgi:hypothetical protein